MGKYIGILKILDMSQKRDLNAQFKSLEKDFTGIRDELTAIVEYVPKQIDDVHVFINSMQREITKIKEDALKAEKERESLHNMLLYLSRQIHGQESQRMNQEIEDLQQMKGGVQRKLQKIEELQRKVQNIEELQQKVQNIEDLQQKIENLQQKVQNIEGLQQKVQNIEDHEHEIADIQQMKKDMEDLKEKLHEIADFQQIKKEIEDLKEMKPDIENLPEIRTDIKTVRKYAQQKSRYLQEKEVPAIKKISQQQLDNNVHFSEEDKAKFQSQWIKKQDKKNDGSELEKASFEEEENAEEIATEFEKKRIALTEYSKLIDQIVIVLTKQIEGLHKLELKRMETEAERRKSQIKIEADQKNLEAAAKVEDIFQKRLLAEVNAASDSNSSEVKEKLEDKYKEYTDRVMNVPLHDAPKDDENKLNEN